MSNPKLVRLTPDEAGRVASLVRKHGEREAARMLGLFSRVTVLRAACRLPCHPLTLGVVRAHLSEILEGASRGKPQGL